MRVRWLDSGTAPRCPRCGTSAVEADRSREIVSVATVTHEGVSVDLVPVEVLQVAPCGCTLQGSLALTGARLMFRQGWPCDRG